MIPWFSRRQSQTNVHIHKNGDFSRKGKCHVRFTTLLYLLVAIVLSILLVSLLILHVVMTLEHQQQLQTQQKIQGYQLSNASKLQLPINNQQSRRHSLKLKRRFPSAVDNRDNPNLTPLLQRTRPQEKIVYFLHIHKSGGTSMCVLAHHGNNLSTPSNNCNVQSNQRCCGHNDSLEAQQKFAAASTYDFVASESYMYQAMDLEHYRYVVVLRNSQSRYFSHWKHMITDSRIKEARHQRRHGPPHSREEREDGFKRDDLRNANPQHIQKNEKEGGDRIHREKFDTQESPRRNLQGQHHKNNNNTMYYRRHGRPTVRESFADWWAHQPDQWNFRQICGTQCMTVPKFQISLKDWEDTLHRLFQFDTVLFLEDYQAGVDRMARTVLHWPVSNLTLAQERGLQAQKDAAIQAAKERWGLASGHHHGNRTEKEQDWDAWYEKTQRRQARKRMGVEEPDPNEMDKNWNPLMTILDDAMYHIAKQWEDYKDTTNKLSHELTKDELLPLKQLPHDLEERFTMYMDESQPHRHQCQNPCCGKCSRW